LGGERAITKRFDLPKETGGGKKKKIKNIQTGAGVYVPESKWRERSLGFAKDHKEGGTGKTTTLEKNDTRCWGAPRKTKKCMKGGEKSRGILVQKVRLQTGRCCREVRFMMLGGGEGGGGGGL